MNHRVKDIKCPTGKVKYLTRQYCDEQIEEIHKQQGQKFLRSYACGECGFFHKTKAHASLEQFNKAHNTGLRPVDLPTRIPGAEPVTNLSLKKAAEYLGISYGSLVAKLQEPNFPIPYEKGNKEYSFNLQDLERYHSQHHGKRRLSYKAAANLSNKSVQSIHHATSSGRLKKYSFLGTPYVLPEDLAAFNAGEFNRVKETQKSVKKLIAKGNGEFVDKCQVEHVPLPSQEITIPSTERTSPEPAVHENTRDCVNELNPIALPTPALPSDKRQPELPPADRAHPRTTTIKELLLELVTDDRFEIASELLDLMKNKQ